MRVSHGLMPWLLCLGYFSHVSAIGRGADQTPMPKFMPRQHCPKTNVPLRNFLQKHIFEVSWVLQPPRDGHEAPMSSCEMPRRKTRGIVQIWALKLLLIFWVPPKLCKHLRGSVASGCIKQLEIVFRCLATKSRFGDSRRSALNLNQNCTPNQYAFVHYNDRFYLLILELSTSSDHSCHLSESLFWSEDKDHFEPGLEKKKTFLSCLSGKIPHNLCTLSTIVEACKLVFAIKSLLFCLSHFSLAQPASLISWRTPLLDQSWLVLNK